MGFRLVPKLVTLSDLERPCVRYYALFHTIRQLSEPSASNWLKLDPYCRWPKCSLGSLVFGNIFGLWRMMHAMSAVAELLVHQTTVWRHKFCRRLLPSLAGSSWLLFIFTDGHECSISNSQELKRYRICWSVAWFVCDGWSSCLYLSTTQPGATVVRADTPSQRKNDLVILKAIEDASLS